MFALRGKIRRLALAGSVFQPTELPEVCKTGTRHGEVRSIFTPRVLPKTETESKYRTNDFAGCQWTSAFRRVNGGEYAGPERREARHR